MKRKRKKRENGHIFYVIESRKNIWDSNSLGISNLAVASPNLVVDSLLKLALKITQMDLSAVECWLDGGDRARQCIESIDDPV